MLKIAYKESPLGNVNAVCPHCGNTLAAADVESPYNNGTKLGQKLNRLRTYSRTTSCYGSPIRKCTKCSGECYDPNMHEIAIEGIRTTEFDIMPRVKILLLFLAMGLITLLWFLYEYNFLTYYHMALPFLAVFCGIGCLYISGEIISIKLGYKAAKLEELRIDSVNRMKDKEYVRKLIDLGYPVPEEYKP